MKLPKTDESQKYVGLYVVDFGDQCGLGYTAEEVGSLLESESYRHIKVYKVHRAQPDGQMALAGVPNERFSLESGMFFHCLNEQDGQKEYEQLCQWTGENKPPCRAKIHLSKQGENFLIGLIYPAEYEQEIGRWIHESGFKSHGPVDAGVSQVEKYYQQDRQILQREQLWPDSSQQARDLETLRACVGMPLQR